METGKRGVSQNAEHLDLINPEPEFIPVETQYIIGLIDSRYKKTFVRSVYEDISGLFMGKRPGYRACNTSYHDFEHTADTLLAMARLMHGAAARGERFSERSVRVGLAAALLHDTGYIQTIDDTEGTGAKYTLTHVDRSIEFTRLYFLEQAISEDDFLFCRNCLLCTGVRASVAELHFRSNEEKRVGQMLGSADLLGQMADRKYLEKLLFLFHEFQEGDVPGYDNELDLLQKTLDFNRGTEIRLIEELGNAHLFMRPHFFTRWGLDCDFYRQAINRNMAYIRQVLAYAEGNHRELLRRGGVVNRLRDGGI